MIQAAPPASIKAAIDQPTTITATTSSKWRVGGGGKKINQVLWQPLIE